MPFGYLLQSHVSVTLDNVPVEPSALTWLTTNTIQLPNPASTYVGKKSRVARRTPNEDPYVVFTAPAGLDVHDLNNQVLQLLYVAQEAYDAGGNAAQQAAEAASEAAERAEAAAAIATGEVEDLEVDSSLSVGPAAMLNGETFGMKQTATGYAPSLIFKASDFLQSVEPSADSDLGDETFTDYVTGHFTSIVPIGTANDVGKQRAGAFYTFNFGNGAQSFGFGVTAEYWNQRDSQVAQATGALILCYNNYDLHGASGKIGTASGASILFSNFRNSGDGADVAHGALIRATNEDAGNIPFVAGVTAEVHSNSTGTLPFVVAVDAAVRKASGATIGTGIGVRTAMDGSGGAWSNFYHLYGKNPVGVVSGEHFFLYGETSADSYLAGRLGIGTKTPRFALHAHEPSAGAVTLAKFSSAATGGAATDGFDIALTSSGDAILRQREATSIIFEVGGAGSQKAQLTNGLVVGSSGSDPGTGSVRVTGDVFKGSTAYNNPDYVFEHYYDGRIKRFKDREGAKTYGGLMPLNELREHTRQHMRLPGITDDPAGFFERGDIALEKIEEAFLHLMALDERIANLERSCH